jgi:hypothetical protein
MMQEQRCSNHSMSRDETRAESGARGRFALLSYVELFSECLLAQLLQSKEIRSTQLNLKGEEGEEVERKGT